jgi:hypothetical protein
MGIGKTGKARFDGQRPEVPVGERPKSSFSDANNGYSSHI